MNDLYTWPQIKADSNRALEERKARKLSLLRATNRPARIRDLSKLTSFILLPAFAIMTAQAFA